MKKFKQASKQVKSVVATMEFFLVCWVSAAYWALYQMAA